MGLTDLFSWVLGRSLTAGVVIVLVCLVRLLLTDEAGTTVRLELDPDGDLCRMDGAYIFYGAYEEPEYVYRLWGCLGLDQWPEAVYAACHNALRPMA